jgi:hypothetical protein
MIRSGLHHPRNLVHLKGDQGYAAFLVFTRNERITSYLCESTDFLARRHGNT